MSSGAVAGSIWGSVTSLPRSCGILSSSLWSATATRGSRLSFTSLCPTVTNLFWSRRAEMSCWCAKRLTSTHRRCATSVARNLRISSTRYCCSALRERRRRHLRARGQGRLDPVVQVDRLDRLGGDEVGDGGADLRVLRDRGDDPDVGVRVEDDAVGPQREGADQHAEDGGDHEERGDAGAQPRRALRGEVRAGRRRGGAAGPRLRPALRRRPRPPRPLSSVVAAASPAPRSPSRRGRHLRVLRRACGRRPAPEPFAPARLAPCAAAPPLADRLRPARGRRWTASSLAPPLALVVRRCARGRLVGHHRPPLVMTPRAPRPVLPPASPRHGGAALPLAGRGHAAPSASATAAPRRLPPSARLASS